ncbi:MAG TPA: universal stress protein [Vicinamibacterales bacterium]|jgi:nucleotide-binding universal stress UspA family protein
MIALKQVLVATDFGEASDVALRYGQTLAKHFGAHLHVLHVAQNAYFNAVGSDAYVALSPGLQEEVEAAAKQQLAERVIDSDGSGPRTTAVVQTSTSPVFTILDYAKRNRIDLIVMGTHGRGPMAHLLMGSVAERVVRLAPCPVLTVRHPEHEFVMPDALVAAARV